jgi:hypothetical protein
MYYSYVEIEYVATSFSPARMDLALKLLSVALNSDLSLFSTFTFNHTSAFGFHIQYIRMILYWNVGTVVIPHIHHLVQIQSRTFNWHQGRL